MSETTGAYLDYAAATPIGPEVVEAMLPYFSEKFYNPSAAYAPAIEVRHDYEAAKEQLAMELGAKKDQIIIVAGATESINLAFTAAGEGHVVVSDIEYQAVIKTAQANSHTIVPVRKTGRIDPKRVLAAITDKTTLVSIGLVNSELGTIQPVDEIGRMMDEIRRDRKERGVVQPLYLHTDASQAAAFLDLKVNRLNVDLLTASAAKLYGPKQMALLYVANDVQLMPTVKGAGQERGLRAGTENVAGVIGFAKAYQIVSERRKSEVARLSALRDNLERQLIEALPETIISGDRQHRIANMTSVAFPGVDGERLVFALEKYGVYVATGSACAANKGVRSRVLTAIGLEPHEVDGSLRISLGYGSTQESTDQATQHIIDCVQREKARMDRVG